MACVEQVRDEEEGVTNAPTNSAWMRRNLTDSIYLWACGEKADDEDDDIKLSDRLIGWVILFMQGFAYTMLIVLATPTSRSDTDSSADDSEGSGYLLPSITGAMYLLVASTTHDLRAGYSLLVDGSCVGHRAFGTALLIVYGIMITAAMTVLVSTSDDSASVVLNAVTVLFIADLDEKTLKFLSTVPQKWRLFWAVQSIGISFSLALLAVVYMGDGSSLLGGSSYKITNTIPTWGFWVVGPAAVTWCSFRLSAALQAVCDLIEAGDSSEQLTFSVLLPRAMVVVRAALKHTRERLRAEFWFFVFLGAWLVQGVGSWPLLSAGIGFPLAFDFVQNTQTSDESTLVLTPDIMTLIVLNAVVATGLAMKALGVYLRRPDRATAIPEPRISSEGNGAADIRGNCCTDSRVPSLLVGWGIGYWVTSLLFVLGCSWHGGGCGWNDPPVVVTVIGYTMLPCFLVAGIFMVADTNFLGTRFGAFVQPAVNIMKNRRFAAYWVLATVLRDVVVVWIIFCLSL